jgi:ParB family chromosome partitioning protein
MDVEDNEAMELALVENLQRKDLDPFEEADGLNALSESYGYSHETIARKIGKSRSTITETIHLQRVPKEIREICKRENIISRSTILEIAKQKNTEDMKRLIEEITRRDLKREDTRELSKIIKGTSKKKYRFVFNYRSPERGKYKLRIDFKKEEVNKEEIIQILREVINKLESS